MSPKKIARRFFHMEMGRIPDAMTIAALADELTAAERRGEERVLALLRPEAPSVIALIEQRLAQSRTVSPSDGGAQRGEDVTDQHRATPAGGG